MLWWDFIGELALVGLAGAAGAAVFLLLVFLI
jgi:hypothetical protein